MNERCKYCDYVSKCSRICEYNSVVCKLTRSFPKIVDKSYEQLQQENEKLNGAIQTYDILLKSNVEENKRLKDNWNKLKEWVKNNIKYWEKEEKNWIEMGIAKVGGEANNKIIFKMILDIVEELEQGSDSK